MNRRLLAGLGTIVLAAGTAGWFRPIAIDTTSSAANTGTWRLPTPETLERASIAQFQAIRDVRWVGGEATGTADAATPWTLLGLVGEVNARAILIRTDGDPLIKRVRPGDTLPDGSMLVSVGNDEIVVERNGCRFQRALYPTSDGQVSLDSAPGRCPPPEPN